MGALILQLHSQLRSCLTALGIRHCGCLDSCSGASSAHYFVRRSSRRRHCASLALGFDTTAALSATVMPHYAWRSTLRLPRQLQLCFINSTLLCAWLPQLRCPQPDALFTRGRRLFSS